MCNPKVMGSGHFLRQLPSVLANDNEGRQYPMSLDYCLHAKGVGGSPHPMIGEHCAQATEDASSK